MPGEVDGSFHTVAVIGHIGFKDKSTLRSPVDAFIGSHACCNIISAPKTNPARRALMSSQVRPMGRQDERQCGFALTSGRCRNANF
jgi:hypothetical protein